MTFKSLKVMTGLWQFNHQS